MRLGTRGQYAVLALVDLALYGKDFPVRLSEIAARQSLPLLYLEQLFCTLRRSGVVTSTRGASGGYQLSRPPQELTVGVIINAAQEEISTTRCQDNALRSCQGKSERCLTHDLWKELKNRIQDYFEEISLSDVIEGRLKKGDMK